MHQISPTQPGRRPRFPSPDHSERCCCRSSSFNCCSRRTTWCRENLVPTRGLQPASPVNLKTVFTSHSLLCSFPKGRPDRLTDRVGLQLQRRAHTYQHPHVENTLSRLTQRASDRWAYRKRMNECPLLFSAGVAYSSRDFTTSTHACIKGNPLTRT